MHTPLVTSSPPHTLPPSLWSQVSVQHLLPHIQYYTCHPSPPPSLPPPPSPCSQVSHPLMMVGRTVTKSRLVNGGRSAVPMVLNFGGSESSSQGLLLTHLTTSTLAHLHHTHNCTIVPHTHSVMAPPIHLGAWSMALMLWLSFELLLLLHHTHLYHTHVQHCIHMYTHSCTKRTQYVRTYTLKHTDTQIYLHSHTFYITYSTTHSHTHTHPHTPTHTLPPSPESGDPRIVERPGCQPQMAPHNNMICTTKVRKTHQHRM